jgi:hypothetical protein
MVIVAAAEPRVTDVIYILVPLPAEGAVDCHVVPLEVRTLPEVPGATVCGAEVPLPSRTLLDVSDVAPVPPLATDKVPVVPATIGRPLAFVRVAAEGVPRLGVVSVGLVLKTTEPVPVDEVTPVPPLATGSVPVTPEARFISSSVPPRVKLPELVTVPVKVRPLTVPVPLTLVTVPEPPAETYSKAVPAPFTASTWFALPKAVKPVPPLATGRVPVTFVVRFANVVEVVPVPPLAIGRVPVT